MVLMNTVCEPLIIHLSVHIHLMDGLSMAPSLGLAVEGFRGVEAAAVSSAVGEGSVVGDNKKIVVAWGPSMEPNPLTPLGGKGDLPNGRHG